MTKSTRHKKIRKAELKKIKLKVGKKLKTAQNETKTDFKAQKIILKEQLAERDESFQLVTKKKLNINELFSRLSHYSVYVRQDGLNGLKELVSKNTKGDLGPYLSLLFTKLSPCLLDDDHLIRTTTVQIIDIVIKKIGNMIKPYFNILASHLSCAMVHLNAGVQCDSLLLMDVLLDETPSEIAHYAHKILKNFFFLISRQINNKKSSGNTKKFVLISNPSSALASIKWRVKLLKSLDKYLESVLGQKAELEASIPVSQWQVISRGCFPSLLHHEDSDRPVTTSRFVVGDADAESFIQTMTPLLFQTWAEVHHGTTSSQETDVVGTPLAPLAVDLLLYISSVVLHFWNIVETVTQEDPLKCEWFMKLMDREMSSEIYTDFPYSVLDGSKGVHKDTKTNVQSLNVKLSHLAFLHQSSNEGLKRNIASCYIDILGTTTADDTELNTLVSSICPLLTDSGGLTCQIRQDLLSASLKCYKRLRNRFSLLKIPLQASDRASSHLWNSPPFSEWMREVVADAIKFPLQEEILELLLQLKLRNTPGFASILTKKKDLLRDQIQKKLKSGAKVQHNIKVVI